MNKYFSYYSKRIKRYFEKETESRLLVTALMVLAVGLLAYGVFYFTKEGLGFTQEETDPFMMEAVPLYIYQLFFLITGFLIFTSTVIFGLFNFFKNEKDGWIMASPSYEGLSWVKFFRALIDSSWPIIVLALPLLFAVRTVFTFSLPYLLMAFFAIIFFSFFIGALAIIIIFIVSIIMKLINLKSFKVLAGIMALICLFAGFSVWRQVVEVDINELFQVEETIDPALTHMIESFSVFPSHFPAMMTHHLQLGNPGQALRYAGVVFVTLLLTLIVFKSLKSKFLYIWQTFQEGSFEAKSKKRVKRKPIMKNPPESPEKVIFRKEVLTNFRSAKNLFWFAFLMTLMFAQVGVVNLLERYVGIGVSEEAALAGFTPSVQTGGILFFISALILRFVFPSFSQEGNTSWIIGSAPIDLKKIFRQKSLFYATLLAAMGAIAIMIYAIPLSIAGEVLVPLTVVIIIGIITLNMVGLSLGTIFINFDTDDPQRLSTSAPGVGFILISLIYSGLSAFLLYRIFLTQNYQFILPFLILSIIIYKTAQKLAFKSLERLEFL